MAIAGEASQASALCPDLWENNYNLRKEGNMPNINHKIKIFF
jgi:hypothetical protein